MREGLSKEVHSCEEVGLNEHKHIWFSNDFSQRVKIV